jgi:hypothetical protein
MTGNRHTSDASRTMPGLAGQEADNPTPAPDIKPPPAEEIYDMEIDIDDADVADDSDVPPFTGEDVEDVGDRRRDGPPRSPAM